MLKYQTITFSLSFKTICIPQTYDQHSISEKGLFAFRIITQSSRSSQQHIFDILRQLNHIIVHFIWNNTFKTHIKLPHRQFQKRRRGSHRKPFNLTEIMRNTQLEMLVANFDQIFHRLRIRTPSTVIQTTVSRKYMLIVPTSTIRNWANWVGVFTIIFQQSRAGNPWVRAAILQKGRDAMSCSSRRTRDRNNNSIRYAAAASTINCLKFNTENSIWKRQLWILRRRSLFVSYMLRTLFEMNSMYFFF